MRRIAAVVVCAALWVAAGDVRADGDNPWARFDAPADGPAHAIGGYRAGCVQGAVALPRRGLGFRVMQPQRKRHFGHPALVGFVKKLARTAKRRGLGLLGVGDLAQPRGGPAPNGHASHQTGLDADLYYVARKGRAMPLVDLKTMSLTRHFGKRVIALLRAAALDDRVDRIFVHPVIKRGLCERAGDDRAWLRKIRPWWGHHHHFHVRLACPNDSPDCEPQDPIADGDGCDQLDWWFRKDDEDERSKRQDKYRERVRSLPELPERCTALVD